MLNFNICFNQSLNMFRKFKKITTGEARFLLVNSIVDFDFSPSVKLL